MAACSRASEIRYRSDLVVTLRNSRIFWTLLAEPDSFRRKALSEQLLAMISASASDNRSSERLSLIDRRTVEASARGNYRPLAASPSPSCSRRLSGSARSVNLFRSARVFRPRRSPDRGSPVTHRRPGRRKGSLLNSASLTP